jgi:NitT/TauT family transport system substrate-binding protein
MVCRGEARLKAVMSPNKSLPFVIVARDHIRGLDDLARATFGIGRIGSIDHSLTMELLRSKSIDTRDMRLLALGEPQWRAQALVAGRLDATTISIGSWASLARKDGLRMLITVSEFQAAVPIVSKVNVVRDAATRERQGEIDSVVRALIVAGRDFRSNKGGWTAAMRAARPDVRPELLDQLALQFRDSWSVNGGLDRAELASTQDWIFRQPDFAGLRPPPLEDWIDFSFVDRTLAELDTIAGLDTPNR